jgi:hypothetical protein
MVVSNELERLWGEQHRLHVMSWYLPVRIEEKHENFRPR